MKLYRFSYENEGIYEALKKEIWKKSKNPKEEWKNFKNSKNITWLTTPPTYNNKCTSYFKEEGYKTFTQKVYPILLEYLEKDKIKLQEVELEINKESILYEDNNQLVIKVC